MKRNFVTLKIGNSTVWKHASNGPLRARLDINDIELSDTDTSQSLTANLQSEADDGTVTAIDITGMTLNLKIRRENGTILDVTGAIENLSDALISFPLDGPTIGEGEHSAQMELTQTGVLEVFPVVDPDGDPMDEMIIRVRAGV